MENQPGLNNFNVNSFMTCNIHRCLVETKKSCFRVGYQGYGLLITYSVEGVTYFLLPLDTRVR